MKSVMKQGTIMSLMIFMIACTKEAKQVSSSAVSQSTTGTHYIGQRFGGGIIFHLDSTGQHGLIASLQDPEEPSVWAYHDTATHARATEIGSGHRNTLKIFRVQGDPLDQAEDYAALECKEFQFKIYTDWYLPSKDELNELYKQKALVGGFNTFSYWSSTEFDVSKAWFQNFSNGSQVKAPKLSAYAIRPIRYF